ncbi:hypothetical protein Hbl1158_02190 [Halobaculum sp. CBA1158]|uniref:HVO_0234 family beta-propeller protein n=1 Tax=Halobaculum sp. CBA1158 TaxID=2904243 RepID=UPI001F1A2EF4|nr:hypothetical protein [Halobaculum sp. CBA1158]UIP00202.1 hypothetical protein Hbl1158_02190 [Halobaculum sp. CBA1158]
MPTIAEKRVFTTPDDVVQVLVATSLGVASVSVSGDIVGEFGIEHRCTARDVAARGDAVAVATDEDVLVGDFAPTGHGPAVAVSVVGEVRSAADASGDPASEIGGDVLAAAPDGTVSRLAGDAVPADDAWEPVGSVEDPHRMDGRLVAAGDGIHRLADGDLEYAGLDDARDVSDRGVPLAVTDEALYTLGNGWMRDLDAGGDGRDGGGMTDDGGGPGSDGRADGEFRCVTADAAGERAVAATDAAVYERADATATEWTAHAESGVVDAAVAGRHLVAVTGDGEARVYADGDWRGRTLGLPDVAAVAVPGAGTVTGTADPSPE